MSMKINDKAGKCKRRKRNGRERIIKLRMKSKTRKNYLRNNNVRLRKRRERKENKKV